MGFLSDIVLNRPYDGWTSFFSNETEEPYWVSLDRKYTDEIKNGEIVYPSPERLFAVFDTPPEAVRCIILGQDPYHEPGQAMGLAFSVPEGEAMPPSLRNIFVELRDDIGVNRTSTDLSDWSRNGIFLVNTALSVRKGKANSHKYFGWDSLVKHALYHILESSQEPLAVILWGNNAQNFGHLFEEYNKRQILVLKSAHPSPLSAYRGFFGSRPFSKVHEFLGEEIFVS